MHTEPWHPAVGDTAPPCFANLVTQGEPPRAHSSSLDEFSQLPQREGLPASVLRWAEELAPGAWQARTAVCRADTDDEEGGLLALAKVSLAMLEEPEGPFYELRLPVPQTRGWGAAQRNELAREQVLVACVRRLGAGCTALLAHARPLQGRLPVQFVFSKDWDECLAPLQKMLVREVLREHLGVARPAQAA